MTPFTRLAVLALVACAHAQYQEDRAPRYIASESKEQATPVPILKQINRHNDDGSYTYGYEAADGSFKIETKSTAGEVKGKYGYKDDTGKLRVIEYGANKYGFQPAGEGITVAPPTLVDETKDEERRNNQQSRRNQYKSAPAQNIDYDYNEEPAPQQPPQAARPAPRPAQQYRNQVEPISQFRAPAPQPQYRIPIEEPQPVPHQPYRPVPPPVQGAFRAPVPSPTQYRQSSQSQTLSSKNHPSSKKPFLSGIMRSQVEHFFDPQDGASSEQVQPQRRQFNPQLNPDTFQLFQQIDRDKPKALFTAPVSTRGNVRPVPSPPRKPYSMLDELLQEYALPSTGANPLHDIVFENY